jgi:hypothetical protein
MFFELSKNKNQDYPNNHELKNGIIFNCDLGWQRIEYKNHVIFFKGYILDRLKNEEFYESIIKDPTPKFNGNFFSIIVGETITITNDNCRGSPLQYRQNEKITNLEQNHTPVWADKYLTVNNDLSVKENQFSPYTVSYENVDYDSALDQVDKILCDSFETFLLKNNKPLKVFLSGGIDTLTMYSYIKKFTKNFEIVDYEYKKFTHFYVKNWNKKIKNFWGYTQIHSWGNMPSVLLTGGCGDEFFLRGPAMLSVLAEHHQIDALALLEKNRQCYHYDYLSLEKNNHYFKNKKTFDTSYRKNVVDHILNNLINDHQHWHIDETVCFTPFKNISIPKIVLNLPKQNIIEQLLDAQFNKDLIIKNNPDDLKFLSTYKNSIPLENLVDIKNAL